jgi:hypothetical protein
MAVQQNQQKSGKNRKIGRQRKKACNMRYKAENRWAKNKARRAIKHLKRLNYQASKIIKVPRGTQRRKNRIAEGKTK